ncbi:hypothetical protein FOZ63_030676 [Perkinsus olseni]|uniref:Uncharacterized protein n=1 Tax=Perkinsus olseni TaxID=32597 RepID=A0A7J6SVJ0_PEROL|nr:hypothetical protein FOZ63_030676 [Perkinsus olseni]
MPRVGPLRLRGELHGNKKQLPTRRCSSVLVRRTFVELFMPRASEGQRGNDIDRMLSLMQECVGKICKTTTVLRFHAARPHPSVQHFTKEQLDAFREAKLEERREQMRQERAKFKQYMEMDQEREAEKKLEEKPSEIGFWRDFQMSFVENVLSDKMKAVMILYGLDTRKSLHHPKHPQIAPTADLIPSFLNMWFPFAWGVAIASSIGFAMPAAIVSAKGLTAFFFLRGGAAAAAVLWNEVKYPSAEPPETTPVVIREKEGMKFGFSQLSKGELALLSFINLAAGAQYISASLREMRCMYEAALSILARAFRLVDPSWASYAIIAGSTAAAGLFPKQLGSAALAVGAPLGLMTGPYSVPLLELLPVQLSLWYATSCVNYAFCHEGKSVPIAITGVAAFGLAAYLGGLHQVFTTCWFLNSSFLLWRAHNNGFEKADWKARRLQGSDWMSKKHSKSILQWWFGAAMVMGTVMGRNFSSRSGMVHREADTESMSFEMKGTSVEPRTARMTS